MYSINCIIISYYNIRTWGSSTTWYFSVILMEVFNKDKYGNDYLCHRRGMVDVN